MRISPQFKRRFAWVMFGVAAVIVIISLWMTQVFVKQIANEERDKVKIWATAIQRKAQLIDYTSDFFFNLQKSERERIQLWASAYQRMTNMDPSLPGYDYEFYRRIVDENTTIPCIITDVRRRIIDCHNTGFDCTYLPILGGSLLREYSVYPPIEVYYENRLSYLVYYKQSNVFSQLKLVLDELANSFFAEVVDNSVSVPVLVVLNDRKYVIASGNIDSEKYETPEALARTLERMGAKNEPIEVLGSLGRSSYFIYYENSSLLSRLRYFPLLILITIVIFISSIIFVYRMARRSEEDRLWVGMSRETAHQLGTPLSSLMAWMEYLRMENVDEESIAEMEKDIQRLKIISERFSKIGSEPDLKTENIVAALYRSTSYLRSRLSSKINFEINVPAETLIFGKLNTQLFDWVIENLAKNAVDAIGAKEGLIQIDISENAKNIFIDISDNGKGIPKQEWSLIFQPGYTTKARGWGLGLALCYRIIKEYHKGKIFVKYSTVGRGTCFRIVLNK